MKRKYREVKLDADKDTEEELRLQDEDRQQVIKRYDTPSAII